MKKELGYGIAFLLVFGLIVSSCSKSKSSNVTPTTTNLLGSYKLTAETGKPENGAQYNLFDSLNACEKDDILQFSTDSVYNYVDAGIVCSPSGDHVGTWDLVSSNSLILDGFSTYTIKSFDNKTLVLTFIDLYSTPTTIFTLTLVKQ